MMMAFDSSRTPPSRLEPERVAALRSALSAYLSDPAAPAPLQHALVAIATDAREKSMPPEQLLILLKEIWNALPEVRTMTAGSAQVTMLQRVVTMCIKEYYAA